MGTGMKNTLRRKEIESNRDDNGEAGLLVNLQSRTKQNRRTAKIRAMESASPFHEPHPLRLHCHPATPASFVQTIEARARLTPEGGVNLAFTLRGDMARLRIPEPGQPGKTGKLWEHTCFEAFFSLRGASAYREFNFSPAGQWAGYAFSGYRQPEEKSPFAENSIPPPLITTRRFAGRLELDALIDRNGLPENPAGHPLDIALSAVVEATDTQEHAHSYWALHHTAARPDFHRRDTFILQLLPQA